MHVRFNSVAMGALAAAVIGVAGCQQTPFPTEPLQTSGSTLTPVQAANAAMKADEGFANTRTALPLIGGAQVPTDVVGELQWVGTLDVQGAVVMAEEPTEEYWEEYPRKLGPGELRIVFNVGPISYRALEDQLAYAEAYSAAYPQVVIQQNFYQAAPIVVQPAYATYGYRSIYAGYRGYATGYGAYRPFYGGYRGFAPAYGYPGGYGAYAPYPVYSGYNAYGGGWRQPVEALYRTQGVRGGGFYPSPTPLPVRGVGASLTPGYGPVSPSLPQGFGVSPLTVPVVPSVPSVPAMPTMPMPR